MIWINLNQMSVYVLYDVVQCLWMMCCVIKTTRILTLLVIGIIDDDDQVVRVEGGSHLDSTSH